MFYCEEDRKKNDWPISLFRSYGRCEMCGKTAECYNISSSSLPDPKPKLPKRPFKPQENNVKITRTETIESEAVCVPQCNRAILEAISFCRYLSSIGNLEEFSINWESTADPNWIKFTATRNP